MAQRRNSSQQQSRKPSKLLTVLALAIACSLPYLLVKNFSHENQEDYIQPLALPEPIKKPSVVVKHSSPITKHTSITKSTTQIAKKVIKDNEWQTINPRPGDSMALIFNRLGLTAKNLHQVLYKNPHAKVLTAIKPSQSLRFLINKHQLQQLIIPVNSIETLIISRVGGQYKTRIDSKKTTTQNIYVTATVKGSLFTTAQRANIPQKLVSKMAEVLKKEIDFAHGIRSGDQFSIIYEGHYIQSKMVGTGELLVASYTSKGKTVQAIRHISANGSFDYYTPKGNSFKKAFSRYPLKFSHISSTFSNSRYHPILRYKRAHKGIDLAAPIGTPIQATGDGVITIIDRHNGYGNMIKIKHDKTYSTVYGHLLKFQKGLSKGSRVKRGQVIGYVGQTGLATGPHCHYELHVNNQPRNPTSTSLPTASPIPSREMASFRAKTGTLLARLKLYEQANLASKGKRNINVG